MSIRFGCCNPKRDKEKLKEKGLGKIFILLDIDGVLNTQVNEDFSNITSSTVWKISNKNLNWIKETVCNPNIQFIWLSTWQKESNEINKFLNIDDFPVSNDYLTPPQTNSITIKKLQINKLRSLYPLAKIISIDDDLNKKEVSSDLHIQPSFEKGLTNKDLRFLDKRIKKYIEKSSHYDYIKYLDFLK